MCFFAATKAKKVYHFLSYFEKMTFNDDSILSKIESPMSHFVI